MSREADFATRMLADAPLVALLPGGIYQKRNVGRVGISRQTTPGAFDNTSGLLLPCALVAERSHTPDGIVRDPVTGHTSAAAVVEVYLYEDNDFAAIDAALTRLLGLFQGHIFTGASASFEVQWTGTVNRERDAGAIPGASMARQEWIVYSIV